MTLTMSPEQIAAEAALLDEAERTRTQIRQTTSVYPTMTMDDAYAIQSAWLDIKVERGEAVVGHKIGLTSRAMQAAMKIDTPDSGFLTADMVFEPNTTIDAARFTDPKLEIELAFVLATDLAGTDLTIDDVLDATDSVTPSIELIAARSFRVDAETGRTRTVLDTISDNAADASLEDRRLNTNSREAGYCSALSSLASQCDALFNEIMKIRACRKARRSVEVECANEIMRSHCDEILAIGQTLASNGGLSVSSATAELRVAIQAQRNQVSQLRVFLETLRTASTLPLPAKSKLVVGVRGEEAEIKTIDLDDVLKEIYSTSRELTDISLSDTLSKLFLSETTSSESAAPPSRHFARRSVDRESAEPR